MAIKRGDGLSESVKKGKLVEKIFFSDNVQWSSKNMWKTMSADVKQQEVKRSGGLSYKEVPSKLEIQGKKGVYFSFDFGSYSIHLNIVC